MSKPTVFISYSHKDEDWKKRLLPHLKALELADLVTVWDDRKIDAGDTWYPEIQKAMEAANVAVCLISPDFLASNFCIKEEVPFLLKKREEQGMLFIPVLTRPCLWKVIRWLAVIQMLPRDGQSLAVEFKDNYDTIFQQVAELIYEFQTPTPEPEPPAATRTEVLTTVRSVLTRVFRGASPAPAVSEPQRPDQPKISLEKLPLTGAELFGRSNELKQLDYAWETAQTHVICFVAWGGVGKSTLVNKWLEYLKEDNYRGAKRVFAWSFYSQGTGEKVTSADLFMKEALTWFDDPQPEQGSPWDKGKRLADLVRREKTLLILDGLEPLQSYSDFEKGKIKDPALAVLVTELAKNNNGLCVITTREPVPELDHYPLTTQTIQLDQISDEAGRALLRVRGIRGTDAELEAITRAFGNHALAINLLTEYLHLFPGHPCQKALEIPDLDVPVAKGKHPRRVMEAFVNYFGEGTELELLCILGLFDRPADQAAIDAVLQGDPIPGLTDHLKNLSEKQWADLLERLRTSKLIARKSAHRPNTLDCHPLVREHFGEKLRRNEQSAWRIAHERLYEYYKSLPKKELPDTLEEMEPLFAAVAHGCQAGKYQEAENDILWKRIRRGNEYYTFHKIGAFGSDLAAVSNLYENPWSQLAFAFSEDIKANIFSYTAFILRALGRLREAAQPMQAGLEMRIKQENWKGAAINAGNLSELYLTLGDVAAAVSYSRQSVDFADRSGDGFEKLKQRCKLADPKHQAGELAAAAVLFQEAESLQAKHQPEYRYLYSLAGFLYCDLLLSQGQVREVLKQAEQTLKWAVQHKISLLWTALDKLSLGRAYLLQAMEQKDSTSEVGASFRQAADYLNQAVTGLRESGRNDIVPLGLFARALLYRLQQDFPRAWEDLAEAQELAERGSMKLWLVDYHLEAFQLRISDCGLRILEDTERQTILEQAKADLEQAKKLIQETGYHRRDPEVEKGYANLFFAQKEPAKAREHLANAKALLDKMGIRMWDWEVKELEKQIERG